MSDRSSSGFAGLIVEGAVIGLVVTLLPKLPLGPLTDGVQAASQRPVLADGPADGLADFSAPRLALPAPPANWRTAVSRPEAMMAPPLLNPVVADPAYADPRNVERRLEEAGQRLVSGASSYLARHAEQVLDAPRTAPASGIWSQQSPGRGAQLTAPSYSPPANRFRY